MSRSTQSARDAMVFALFGVLLCVACKVPEPRGDILRLAKELTGGVPRDCRSLHQGWWRSWRPWPSRSGICAIEGPLGRGTVMLGDDGAAWEFSAQFSVRDSADAAGLRHAVLDRMGRGAVASLQGCSVEMARRMVREISVAMADSMQANFQYMVMPDEIAAPTRFAQTLHLGVSALHPYSSFRSCTGAKSIIP